MRPLKTKHKKSSKPFIKNHFIPSQKVDFFNYIKKLKKIQKL